MLRSRVLLPVGALLAFGSSLLTAIPSFAACERRNDTVDRVCDGALRSAKVRAGDAAPVVSRHGFEGLEGSVATAPVPFSVFSRLFVAANTLPDDTILV